MAHLRLLPFAFSFASLLLLSLSSSSTAADDDRKVYVVYMGALPSDGDYMAMDHHNSMLQEVLETEEVENVVVRNFKRSFNGFAARLTESEKDKLARMEGVVSVFPQVKLELQTTRSWEFMGLTEKITRDANGESNVIIGVIDTGVSPESPSFSDKGFGPPPAKWKGACKGGLNFTCNNKIIGARYYTSPMKGTARDYVGHGSHTASTAAGNHVPDTSFYGLASGTVRGGVPSSRIAVYKTCDTSGCTNVGLLAAFDDAIADGVDIITISIGSTAAAEFQNDPISIGAFHAMARGILTVNSAGNSGPSPKTLSSVSPWLLTVAASTTDRKFIGKLVLGNGKTLEGLSINNFDLNATKFPLVDAKDVSVHGCSSLLEGTCSPSCLDPKLAEGKIVLCVSPLKVMGRLSKVGAAGYIFKDLSGKNISTSVPVPAIILPKSTFDAVASYKNSTEHPVASILKSETVQDPKAPVVAVFSSRGPNKIIPDILKPDITAPGVNILAAYSPLAAVTPIEGDTRHVKYNVISGTSMSCPHVAGVAAYLKSIHPQWSPSVIKSAIMTTAWAMNTTANEDGEFAYGSGHVDPVKATNPGLVYETSKEDYISMLCAMDLPRNAVKVIAGGNTTCPSGPAKLQMRDVNYPSMAAKVTSGGSFNITFRRTVTNVGTPSSTYTAKVIGGTGVSVGVVPESLSFKSLNEKKSFTVTVSGKGSIKRTSASLVWSDDVNVVRSPIVVYRGSTDFDA